MIAAPFRRRRSALEFQRRPGAAVSSTLNFSKPNADDRKGAAIMELIPRSRFPSGLSLQLGTGSLCLLGPRPTPVTPVGAISRPLAGGDARCGDILTLKKVAACSQAAAENGPRDRLISPVLHIGRSVARTAPTRSAKLCGAGQALPGYRAAGGILELVRGGRSSEPGGRSRQCWTRAHQVVNGLRKASARIAGRVGARSGNSLASTQPHGNTALRAPPLSTTTNFRSLARFELGRLVREGHGGVMLPMRSNTSCGMAMRSSGLCVVRVRQLRLDVARASVTRVRSCASTAPPGACPPRNETRHFSKSQFRMGRLEHSTAAYVPIGRSGSCRW